MKRATSPFPLGPVHFIGIGGIGMSGIAEVMLNLGYAVQGSDIKANPNVERLRSKGAQIAIGHAGENVEGAGAIVVSSAIKPDNPELAAARAAKIPVVRRAEMLAELMRLKYAVAVAGTHGKTTTTSLVSVLMDAAGVDPTVINGGIISAYGSNAKVGAGDWMAVEADESDGSFIKLRATVGIVTNIDPEHMEFYGDFDALRAAFTQFVENLPFYGFAVLCTDHAEVQALASRVIDRRVITYGFNPQADVRGDNLRMTPDGATFDISFRLRGRDETLWRDIFLPMMGEHNVLNTLSALAVAFELGLTEDAAKTALAGFGGVKRRFTRTGDWKGAAIIDDYGHHPVEIAAVLKAARQAAGVLQRFDSSGDGKLQFDEFVSLCVASAEGEQITPDAKPAKDADDGDAAPTTLPAWSNRWTIMHGDQIFLSGNASLRSYPSFPSASAYAPLRAGESKAESVDI